MQRVDLAIPRKSPKAQDDRPTTGLKFEAAWPDKTNHAQYFWRFWSAQCSFDEDGMKIVENWIAALDKTLVDHID